MEKSKNVIGGASVYSKKYFLNPEYNKLPNQVLDEIHELCVFYAQKLHCVFTINFSDEGKIYFETRAMETDYNFDEIGAKLDVDKLIRDKEAFIASLELWHKVFIRKERI